MPETEVKTTISKSTGLPRKRFYRALAHSNPLSDSHLPVPISPKTLMIGMELRDKVTKYVKERILSLRLTNPSKYQNVSVVWTNSMKYIPNYFKKAQLTKMFFLFPDPHFKEKNHRRRIISPFLLDEYAYIHKPGGIIYTITDVEELGDWIKSYLENHPMFEALTEKELEADPIVKLLSSATKEGQKVARNGGLTFQAVFRHIVPSDQTS
ncbi:hypothetical protein PIB30_091925 [Stylosanthes scabra]|uniref:tRNA (guanine-N(7)-)-methyltransferase n=1 Tax=Stylosanthes scabra TaxID=79078 RepID=A0ABU6RVC3_9FABA|nr:hypothetical protein [Stylosanthes scabra]